MCYYEYEGDQMTEWDKFSLCGKIAANARQETENLIMRGDWSQEATNLRYLRLQAVIKSVQEYCLTHPEVLGAYDSFSDMDGEPEDNLFPAVVNETTAEADDDYAWFVQVAAAERARKERMGVVYAD